MATKKFLIPDEDRDMKILKLEARLTLILEWISGYFGKVPEDLTLKLNDLDSTEVKLELEYIEDEMSVGAECTVGFSTISFENPNEDPDPEYHQSLAESNVDDPLDIDGSLLTPKPNRPDRDTTYTSSSQNILKCLDQVKLVDIRSITDAPISEENEDSASAPMAPHLCTHCSASFNSVHELSVHSLIHCEVRMRRMSLAKRKTRIKFRPSVKKKSERIVKKPRDLLCEHCPRKFPSQRSLKEHLKVHHPDQIRKPRSTKKCDICEKTFINITGLHRHILKHHPETCPDFKCPTCSKSFKTNNSLKNHMASVHADSDESFACEVCGKTLKSRTSFKDHMRRSHPDPSEASDCDLCGRRFMSRGNMKRHKESCGTEKTYLCQECGHATKTEAALKSHVQYKHPTEVTLHQCPHCPNQFKSHKSLREHLDRHFDKHLKSCPYCGVVQDSKTLYHHINIVHKGRKFQCFYCTSMFSHNAHLKNHYVLKHPELEIPKESKVIYTKDDALLDPEAPAPPVARKRKPSTKTPKSVHPRSQSKRVSELFCEPCDATFVTRDELELHMIRHEKDPDYKMKRRLPVTRL